MLKKIAHYVIKTKRKKEKTGIRAVGIVVHDDSILLLGRKNHDGHIYNTLPGGGIGMNESSSKAAEREVKEETNINATVVRQVYQNTITDIGITEHCFLMQYKSGNPSLPILSEEYMYSWISNERYDPKWVARADLSDILLYPKVIHKQLLHDLQYGFGDEIIKTTSQFSERKQDYVRTSL